MKPNQSFCIAENDIVGRTGKSRFLGSDIVESLTC